MGLQTTCPSAEHKLKVPFFPQNAFSKAVNAPKSIPTSLWLESWKINGNTATASHYFLYFFTKWITKMASYECLFQVSRPHSSDAILLYAYFSSVKPKDGCQIMWKEIEGEPYLIWTRGNTPSSCCQRHRARTLCAVHQKLMLICTVLLNFWPELGRQSPIGWVSVYAQLCVNHNNLMLLLESGFGSSPNIV